ncbi:type VI secretion system protein TssA [Roseimaritima ulvae]|uniref:ImpA N-terminal domain-containing protein n=1 Tax=Roseimaritima ulvae TaxID=980254 RepID=A0A5B9QNK1_9BACT|nr:type VI secretion system protein TssA [Roseimaritima ulvae]QEG40598.1 hypothetical protein UC8_26140 [Roseimaritima ulvae]
MTLLATPSTFDIEALLEPIEGDRIAGDPRAYARGLRSQLSELRTPHRSSNPDAPDQDGTEECVDWMGITVVATEALRETTKDLRIACHLTEAALQHWGIAGLRDGLTLLRKMADLFWNDLAPELDPEDADVRCSPLENLLDDPNRGPRIPSVVRSLPLLAAGAHRLSLMEATGQAGDLTQSEVAAAIRQVTVEDAAQLSDEVDGALAELESFQQLMIDRMGDYAPTFLHLKESLQVVRQWLDSVLRPQLDARDTVDEPAPPARKLRKPKKQSSGDDPMVVVDQTFQLRADAYSQLSAAAETLQQIEPHSPIPYMVQRAVQLGQLPFPALMAQLVNEESTLQMFHRELGLSSSDTGTTGYDD